jgi:hypothetical protein
MLSDLSNEEETIVEESMRSTRHGPELMTSVQFNVHAAVTKSPSDSLEIREKKRANGA